MLWLDSVTWHSLRGFATPILLMPLTLENPHFLSYFKTQPMPLHRSLVLTLLVRTVCCATNCLLIFNALPAFLSLSLYHGGWRSQNYITQIPLPTEFQFKFFKGQACAWDVEVKRKGEVIIYFQEWQKVSWADGDFGRSFSALFSWEADWFSSPVITSPDLPSVW